MHLDYLNERRHLFQEYTFSFNVHLHTHGSFSELISEVDSQEWRYGIYILTRQIQKRRDVFLERAQTVNTYEH